MAFFIIKKYKLLDEGNFLLLHFYFLVSINGQITNA
jgi:hypothetical protein